VALNAEGSLGARIVAAVTCVRLLARLDNKFVETFVELWLLLLLARRLCRMSVELAGAAAGFSELCEFLLLVGLFMNASGVRRRGVVATLRLPICGVGVTI